MKSIARLVLPSLKMHRLTRADTEQDAQNFRARYILRQRGIKTCAALFDKGEMESSGEGDCLKMSGDAGGEVITDGTAGSVGIRSGNGSVLAHVQARNGLGERGIRVEVRVGNAAVP